MSNDLPIPRQDTRPDGADPAPEADGEPGTVRWGPDGADRPGLGRRMLTELIRDNRLAPVLAVPGAIAAFASIAGEWVVTTMPGAGPDGNEPAVVTSGVGEVGGGTAYLVGLLCLAGALGLALRGSAAIRHHARLVGLAVSGAMLVLLAGTVAALDNMVQRMYGWSLLELSFEVEYGRGLFAAFGATAAFGLAFLLTGHPGVDPTGAVRTTGGEEPALTGVESTADGWRGRRSRRPSPGSPPPGPGPVDLTVTPTAPFARPEQPRDR